MRMVDVEEPQHRVGIGPEDVVSGDVHLVSASDERGLEPDGGHVVVAAEQTVGDCLKLNDRHLHDGLGIEVVALHQSLGGPQLCRGAVAECARKRLLHVEEQTVFRTVCEQMQRDAKRLEMVFAGDERMHLALGDEACGGHVGDGLCNACGLGAPEKDLQVAKASGALLDVGLERIGRVLELLMASGKFKHLVAEEAPGVKRLREVHSRLGVESAVAPEAAAFEIRGRY